jgi:hypothetical protein
MYQFTEKDKVKRLTDVLEMIEIIVSKNRFDSSYSKDEIEKFYLKILQGQDDINVYERRDAGISDEKWNKALNELYIYIGIKQEQNETDLF